MEYTGETKQTSDMASGPDISGLLDRDTVRSSYGGGDYDVFCHCRNYLPRNRERSFDMSDYSSCDSCLHQRTDQRCGLAQQTLQ